MGPLRPGAGRIPERCDIGLTRPRVRRVADAFSAPIQPSHRSVGWPAVLAAALRISLALAQLTVLPLQPGDSLTPLRRSPDGHPGRCPPSTSTRRIHLRSVSESSRLARDRSDRRVLRLVLAAVPWRRPEPEHNLGRDEADEGIRRDLPMIQ